MKARGNISANAGRVSAFIYPVKSADTLCVVECLKYFQTASLCAIICGFMSFYDRPRTGNLEMWEWPTYEAFLQPDVGLISSAVIEGQGSASEVTAV